MNFVETLEELGLSPKEAKVYLALVFSGAASVRALAHASGLNRGSVYEALKSLQEQGLISRYQQGKRLHFVAEDPTALSRELKRKKRDLLRSHRLLERVLPELRALFERGGSKKPTAKFFEGTAAMRAILEDVLRVMEGEREKEYYVYSSVEVREHLYHDFSSFSERRVQAGIRVKVIALGAGGELRGLDERRWLVSSVSLPSYIIIYGPKIAMISLSRREHPQATVVEDPALVQTQKFLFHSLWKRLTPNL